MRDELFRWTQGRQGTGYGKFPFLIGPYFDAYLLRYPTGGGLPCHTDPAPGRKHYRLNIILRKGIGGAFVADGPLILDWPRVKLFRADIVPHGLSLVVQGPRLVLSIGWAIPEKETP